MLLVFTRWILLTPNSVQQYKKYLEIVYGKFQWCCFGCRIKGLLVVTSGLKTHNSRWGIECFKTMIYFQLNFQQLMAVCTTKMLMKYTSRIDNHWKNLEKWVGTRRLEWTIKQKICSSVFVVHFTWNAWEYLIQLKIWYYLWKLWKQSKGTKDLC